MPSSSNNRIYRSSMVVGLVEELVVKVLGGEILLELVLVI